MRSLRELLDNLYKFIGPGDKLTIHCMHRRDKGFWIEVNAAEQNISVKKVTDTKPLVIRSLGGWRDNAELVEKIENAGADTNDFRSNLADAIMSRVVMANQVVRDGDKLFGRNIVNAAIQENDRFISDIKGAIDGIFGDDKPPSNLRVVQVSDRNADKSE